MLETVLPSRLGKLKAKGALGSLTVVCWVDSVGAARFCLRASAGRRAVRFLLLGLLGFGGEEVRDEQGAVGLRGEGVESGAGGGEVGDGVVLAGPGAEEGAGVAVDALDDGVDGWGFADRVDAELPGGFTLGALDGDLPVAFDVGCSG